MITVRVVTSRSESLSLALRTAVICTPLLLAVAPMSHRYLRANSHLQLRTPTIPVCVTRRSHSCLPTPSLAVRTTVTCTTSLTIAHPVTCKCPHLSLAHYCLLSPAATHECHTNTIISHSAHSVFPTVR
eukprot:Blabericola_migrator_1__7913@NODE_4050_length_1357_cov_7_288372_g2499_i0_p2_GENE_NODE_4050_length_1357_cov_7_288372_g2499_i0NODE_4050_length_1357_cov_7_288372_g2499_i0_p2_ORF_typecomplete_len129_score1_75FXa_inhibition/PF14670_6/1_6FXa_inhibition/PF14670_6/1_4e02_NODE_4050_length_1357_cov_7_288372_g2499_i0262648